VKRITHLQRLSWPISKATLGMDGLGHELTWIRTGPKIRDSPGF